MEKLFYDTIQDLNKFASDIFDEIEQFMKYATGYKTSYYSLSVDTKTHELEVVFASSDKIKNHEYYPLNRFLTMQYPMLGGNYFREDITCEACQRCRERKCPATCSEMYTDEDYAYTINGDAIRDVANKYIFVR